MNREEASRFLLAEARRLDPDRYLCALFAPPERRDAVLALLVLNQELARISELVTQPIAGAIRLQWWREAVGEAAVGRPRAQPVLEALAAAQGEGRLALEGLLALIDGRERDLEPVPPRDLPDLLDYLAATAGRVQAEIARSLGADEVRVARAREAGVAFGLVGAIRATSFLARQGRQLLPAALLERGGVPSEDLAAARMSPGLAHVVATLLSEVPRCLPRDRLPRPLMAAFLPGRLARLYAHRIAARGHDPYAAGRLARPVGSPLALLAAYLRRRV